MKKSITSLMQQPSEAHCNICVKGRRIILGKDYINVL